MAQARAALKKYKDVMEAAERIFDGAFDDVVDEPQEKPASSSKVGSSRKARMIVSVKRHCRVSYLCNFYQDSGR